MRPKRRLVLVASDSIKLPDQAQASDGRAHDLDRAAADPDGDLDEVVTPTLLGTRARAPYFHDGSAVTLEAALEADTHGSIPVLDEDDRRQLLTYLGTR